jgi:hypothetical protein
MIPHGLDADSSMDARRQALGRLVASCVTFVPIIEDI